MCTCTVTTILALSTTEFSIKKGQINEKYNQEFVFLWFISAVPERCGLTCEYKSPEPVCINGIAKARHFLIDWYLSQIQFTPLVYCNPLHRGNGSCQNLLSINTAELPYNAEHGE